MSKARYLVTGGAGFIGSNLAVALARRGEQVRVLDNLATGRWGLLRRLKHDGPAVEEMTGDIRDAERVARAMDGVETVFHEAALGSVPRSVEDPVTSDDVNVHGTVTVLDAARRAGVKRIVFAASSAAYGETPTLPKQEDMAPAPLSPYAVTKLTCEQYMRVFARLYPVETLSLRYFNVFGPNQLPSGAYAAAIPRFIYSALGGEPIEIFGDGEQTRDFCFIDNIIHANLLAAGTPKKLEGQVINIAGGRRISLNELVNEIERVIGKPVHVNRIAPRAGDILHSLGDISRAKELIGYEPKVRWEDGIPSTVAFMRSVRERDIE